jgi:hypothetical protein
MRRLSRDKRYLRIRRWVDRDVSRPSVSSVAIGPACLALAPFVALEYLTDGAAPNALLALPAPIALGWFGFVCWRGSRMARAGMLKSSRDYDRKGKYLLPPEYANSESSFAAARRKRLSRDGANRHSGAV